MNEETLVAVGHMCGSLGDLFARQINNTKTQTENDIWEKAANACYKAGTRKLIINPQDFSCEIKFQVPNEV